MFAPFFIGKGTGLGLSMVYGFAKQSGGNWRRHDGHFAPAQSHANARGRGESRAKAGCRGRRRRILVVEDDEDPTACLLGCCAAARHSFKKETLRMNTLIARCCRLTPARWASWYAVPLCLVVGLGFMQHGYAKLARGPEAFVTILHALGVPAPALLAWTTIWVELLGGLAVVVGVLIPLASLPMAVVLLVAIWTVHLPNGFSSIKLLSVDAAGAHFGQPGYETDLLYLAGLVALVLGGSGPLALDRLLLRESAAPNQSLGEPAESRL